jgi:ABC-type nickel/cobalt efflux system permease component RcnA
LGIPDILTQPLEAAVGVMLIGLGAHVLWRLWRNRMHFHPHRDGVQQIRQQPNSIWKSGG